MPDVSRRRALPEWLPALVAALALTLAGPLAPSLPGQAADPPKPIASHERQKLEAQAAELFQAGFQAYQQGDLVVAVAKTRESLRIREKLYSKDLYPQGHPHLAEGLNNLGGLLRRRAHTARAVYYDERWRFTSLSIRRKATPRAIPIWRCV